MTATAHPGAPGLAPARARAGQAFAVQAGLFFRRKLMESLRQPAWIVMGLTTPLLYLALFTPLLNALADGPGFPPGHVLDVFVPGILLKQIGSLAAVVTGVQLPLTLLSGILLPLSLLTGSPGGSRRVAGCAPAAGG